MSTKQSENHTDLIAGVCFALAVLFLGWLVWSHGFEVWVEGVK